MTILKLKKADCKEIVNMTFPIYKGRKFKLSLKEKHYIYDSYWDGGSRIFTKFIQFEINKIKELPERIHEGKEFDIPDNILIVEHSYFCGNDMGITIICTPTSEFIKGKNLLERDNT